MMNHGEKNLRKTRKPTFSLPTPEFQESRWNFFTPQAKSQPIWTQHMQPSSLTHSVRPIRCTMQVAAEWIDLRQPGSEKNSGKTLQGGGLFTARTTTNTPGLGLENGREVAHPKGCWGPCQAGQSQRLVQEKLEKEGTKARIEK